MKLAEIMTPDVAQRRVEQLKKNAKHAQQQAKAAQAKLKIQQGQQQLASTSSDTDANSLIS